MSISKVPFFLALLVFFTSCDGQVSIEFNSKKDKSQSQLIASGKKVKRVDVGPVIFFEDNKGNLWLANDKLYRFDGKQLVRFSEEDGLPGERIIRIDEDQNGALYINRIEGVMKFDENVFEELEVNERKRNSDWRLEPGDLWFIVDFGENQVYRSDGKWLYPLSFSNHPLESQFADAFANPSFSPFGVYSILVDDNGFPWFGTAAAGACRYDGKSFTWILEENVMEFNEGSAPGVRSMLEDRNGNFWFNNDILHRYRMEDNNYIALAGIDTTQYTKMPFSFMSIAQAGNGDLWMTTYTEGVWLYDGENLIHYPIQKDGDDLELYSIFADSNGEVWLGTHKEGVYRFDGYTFQSFTIE
ncbi:hypothetical protein O3Q51_05215 [Cryomorphaceae bacterium 1068]|nr:hypothetical protein [Cryomorphaceae bacterium 1068]